MKARPILMSAPMVRALLEGRKTQTRRIIKPQPLFFTGRNYVVPNDAPKAWHESDDFAGLCPYGVPGDLLWCRETWSDYWMHEDDAYGEPVGGGVDYRATWNPSKGDTPPWKPSIHMPRQFSRLTLEITDVRVERLQAISESDAYAEGVTIPSHHAFVTNGNPELRNEARDAHRQLWESINGRGSWDANPWVWVLEFRVHQRNVDQILAHLATTSTTSGKEPNA